MSGIISKEDFTTALSEGIPIPAVQTQSDIDGFSVRMIEFFTKTPNDFWIDHDPSMEVDESFYSALTIDFGALPTLRVLIVPGLLRFTLAVSSLDEVDNQEAVGQAAMGVMLFCALENGQIEKVDPDDDDPQRVKKVKVNTLPKQSKSYAPGDNKKFDIDWV